MAQSVHNRRSILIPSLDHSLYAIETVSGRDRWIYRTTVPLSEPVTPLDTELYVRVPGTGLVALDWREGNEMWVMKRDARALTNLDQKRVLMHADGRLVTVERSTGLPLEEVEIDPVRHILPAEDSTLILIGHRGRVSRIDFALD